MPITYRTPSGSVSRLFLTALSAPHLLIAGATGSGKSVLENGLIATLLYRAPGYQPDGVELILIDVKRVELAMYRNLPHTLMYASEPCEVLEALQAAVGLVELRYKEMSAHGEKTYSGGDIYVIIDEFADLMTMMKKEVAPLVQRIAQIGRAAKVHIILCTQCPLAEVIPTKIKVNFDTRFCLRTATKSQSQYVLGSSGCEFLPNPRTEGKAQGYFCDGSIKELYNLPYVRMEEIRRLVTWWTSQTPRSNRSSQSWKKVVNGVNRLSDRWKSRRATQTGGGGFFAGLFKAAFAVLMFLYVLNYCSTHFE